LRHLRINKEQARKKKALDPERNVVHSSSIDRQDGTCDKDEAAVEGEEGADAVEEVLEVNLVLEEGRGAVGAAELHEPAGQVHAHLLVPGGAGGRGIQTSQQRRISSNHCIGSKKISLEVLERELLLARVEDVPEVLHPHRTPVAGAGEERVSPNGTEDFELLLFAFLSFFPLLINALEIRFRLLVEYANMVLTRFTNCFIHFGGDFFLEGES
jgi:hypothetical protein